tara:strand:- start:65762 stop:68002 length:2241 start_codon:yes stop_codon:yes gene_type:complete
MKLLVGLFLLTMNVFALDSRTKPPAEKPPADRSADVNRVNVFANKNSLDQVLGDQKFQERFAAITGPLEQQWPAITTDLKSRFSREIDRYNFSTVFGLQGNKLKILGGNVAEIETNIKNFQISADAYYRLELKPSFREGKQMRKDIYVIGLKGSSTISIGSEVRITFFREFDSKADALSNLKPYGLDRIPKSSADLIKKINIDDGVRVEVMGNLEISKEFNKIANSSNLSAILGYDLFQGLFTADIYRYTETDVRARFMGTINRGTVKAKAGLNWLYSFKGAKILPRWLKELFEVNLDVNISKSFNFFDRYPIETHVADYYFRFNNMTLIQASVPPGCNFQVPTGIASIDSAGLSPEAAFDEVLHNVRSGKFMAVFNPNLEESALSASFLRNASRAETIACVDASLPNYKKRVQHFFKGRMLSDVFSLNFGPKISHLLRSTQTEGNSEVYVASLERGQEFNYYILLNTATKTENSFLFGRWENEYESDLDALYQSDKEKNIRGFLDFVKRIQYRDKVMSTSKLSEIRDILARSIPTNFPDRNKLLDLVPKTEQRDAWISFVYTLSSRVIFELEKMDKLVLYTKLANFVANHPERNRMGLPSDNNEGGEMNQTEYINELYYRLVKLTDSTQNSKDRFRALEQLMKDRIFTEYIFREFFPSLITSDIANNEMSVAMSVTSKDITLAEDRIGNNQYSQVYSAVLLLRSILNDRSLDIRLESATAADPSADAVSGPNSSNPVNMKGFKVF